MTNKIQEIAGALPNACALCPWRISNQGTPHPHGFYDKANIKRLWDGIRRGDAPGMSCHPTDPRMAEFEGYEETAERTRTHECMGSWVMVAREMERFQAICKAVEREQQDGATFRSGEALRRYRAATSGKAMTREGLAEWAWRIAVVMPGQARLQPTIEAMNDHDIGTHLTLAWDPAILEANR